MSPTTGRRLGHVGIWADDLPGLRAFYTQVLALEVSDEGKDICFLSSRPTEEHHELVLVQRHSTVADQAAFNQISWRVDTIEELLAMYRRVRESGASVEGTFSHGYALSVYFHDPEGNRGEIYWVTGLSVHQPYKQAISFDASPSEIVRNMESLLATHTSEWAGSS